MKRWGGRNFPVDHDAHEGNNFIKKKKIQFQFSVQISRNHFSYERFV